MALLGLGVKVYRVYRVTGLHEVGYIFLFLVSVYKVAC